MSKSSGNFVWYELMTSDLEAATTFYGHVVGWSLKDFDPTPFRYVMGCAGEVPVAGMMTIPDEAKANGMVPAWVGYVGVADIDAACARLEKAGGRVDRKPAIIPSVGRFAMVADPQGAMFVLFTPDNPADNTPTSGMTPGRVGWHELMTSDWEKALAFYSGQFGWVKSTAMDMGPMGTYQLFKSADGAADVGGMMTLTQVPHPFWLFYFVVDDIDAAVARVAECKGELVMGPMEVPGGAWVIQARDPQGAHFALVGMRKAAA